MGPDSSGAGFNYSCSSKCGGLGLRTPYEGTRRRKSTDFIISGESCLEYSIYSPVGACESSAGSYYTSNDRGVLFLSPSR